ncbi:hypothetical protein FHG87_014845 [Trinorchestia longiramus]|nr:hypothetical protein FHG87_014845 [Trinorchestia longiramus]
MVLPPGLSEEARPVAKHPLEGDILLMSQQAGDFTYQLPCYDPQQKQGAVLGDGQRSSVSHSRPYRPPGGVEEMQGGGRRVRLEWGRILLYNIQ